MSEPKKLFSPTEVAADGGTDAKTVREIASELGLGELVGGRLVLDQEEADAVLDALEAEE